MSASGDATNRAAAFSTWPAGEPLPLALLRTLIARHAPVILFHPEEPYFPANVDWYLARALLIDGASGNVIKHHPAPGDLPQGPAAPDQLQRYWLTLDPALAGPALEPELAPPDDPRRGDLNVAKAYVRAVHDPAAGHTELQFWMFYPYDGPGLVRLRPRFIGGLRTDATISLWPGGMHEADWELAVVRIDHATLAPSGVLLSQHQGGDAHLGAAAVAELEREPSGQIRLYASRYGHASYAHPQERKLVYFNRTLALAGLELGLIDQVAGGRSWNLGDATRHELISTSWSDPGVIEPLWLGYAWRWGAYEPAGGRFRRKLVDDLRALLESHMAPPVLLLHLLTLGLSAALLALAPRLLGGPIGAKLLGHAADNSGPFGPHCQKHKWSGDYGFTGPPAPQGWLADGPPLVLRTGGLLNAVCRPPVRILGLLLGAICAPFLPKD